ncbi:hypothetical protein DMB66_31305 [Actinoplanes sp. ATCC 53533]|uniref:hypothetical protein n=1 Tax=Actinoplanes sp. ATCC 53533 TaxID=1288362 RepID=UPI000F7A47DC|nr:hypothetical protein [Actinoplanes sp. ATCC 53533]RSM57991.1 hypothetical protein DMB66_31305 [Actinoplanes sp. ATCC 53533]
MSRRQRTGRIRWLIGAAATLTLLGAGVVAANPAQAGVSTVSDGFEGGNPYLFWNVRYDHGRSIVNLINHVNANTEFGGQWLAWLEAPGTVPARISSDAIVLPEPSGGQVTCRAQAWAAKAGDSVGSPRVQMSVNSRSGSVDTVIAGTTYTLTDTEYGRAEFAFWPYRANANLVVDISVTGGSAYVDDVSIRCASAIG